LDTALKLARYLQIHVDEIWGLVEDSEELEKEKKNAGSRK
jgi:DNA-binding XRE family transcriptional regulator